MGVVQLLKQESRLSLSNSYSYHSENERVTRMELASNLNQAHYLAREAERLLKRKKFDAALALQDRIVDLLELAKADSTNNKVTQSIELQILHQLKQKLVITQKRDNYTKDLHNLHLRMAKASIQDAGLQDSIYRTFQETESLLQHLKDAPSDPSTGAKMPKSDKVIIEELSTANNHLRGMVEAMFAELETYKKENAELKSKLSELEAAKGESRVIPPSSELGLEDMTRQDLLHDSGHLPPLAPLELPDFDYNIPSTNKD